LFCSASSGLKPTALGTLRMNGGCVYLRVDSKTVLPEWPKWGQESYNSTRTKHWHRVQPLYRLLPWILVSYQNLDSGVAEVGAGVIQFYKDQTLAPGTATLPFVSVNTCFVSEHGFRSGWRGSRSHTTLQGPNIGSGYSHSTVCSREYLFHIRTWIPVCIITRL
jgi:hypothetical protein